MTPDKSIRFDFAAAVAGARLMFPAETADVYFIDLSGKQAAQRLAAWYRKHAAAENKIAELPGFLRDVVQAYIGITARLYGWNHRTHLGFASEKLVALQTRDFDIEMVPGEAKSAAFAFYHELGHVLMPAQGRYFTPDMDAEVPLREGQADTFAALFGLRDGWLTKDDIRTLADIRARASKTHDTQSALLALLKPEMDARIMRMTPKDIVAFAKDHGYRHWKWRRQFPEAKKIYRPKPQ